MDSVIRGLAVYLVLLLIARLSGRRTLRRPPRSTSFNC